MFLDVKIISEYRKTNWHSKTIEKWVLEDVFQDTPALPLASKILPIYTADNINVTQLTVKFRIHDLVKTLCNNQHSFVGI